MRGCITGKDVFRYAPTIVRLWGPGFYLRCCWAVISGRRCTFLEVLAPVPTPIALPATRRP